MLYYSFKIFSSPTCKLYSRPFPSLLSDTTLRPGFLGQWFNNLQRAALLTSFWRQWFNNLQRTAFLTSLIQYDRILGQQQLFMVNYVCGFNQLEEIGKIFWMNNKAIIEFDFRRIWRILQISEGVIHLGLRPWWITLSSTCRILHILRKPNSLIAKYRMNFFCFAID